MAGLRSLLSRFAIPSSIVPEEISSNTSPQHYDLTREVPGQISRVLFTNVSWSNGYGDTEERERETTDIKTAQVVSSLVRGDHLARHVPTFDLDLPARLTARGSHCVLTVYLSHAQINVRNIQKFEIVLKDLGLLAKNQTVVYENNSLVIPFNVPVTLVESSTADHHHVYIDSMMSWAMYTHLLKHMVAVGLVEKRYYKASVRRGHSDVRLPWIKKSLYQMSYSGGSTY